MPPSARDTARWAAGTQVLVAATYWIVGLCWLLVALPGDDPFRPRDPYLAILESLLILSAATFLLHGPTSAC